MSTREYQIWEGQERVDSGLDWTELTIARFGGYPLSTLKESIDSGLPGWGPHDVMIKLVSSEPGEFMLKTMEEQLGEGAGFDLMVPYRYMNFAPLSFSKVHVVYDPRAEVSPKPVDELEQFREKGLWECMSECLKEMFGKSH